MTEQRRGQNPASHSWPPCRLSGTHSTRPMQWAPQCTSILLQTSPPSTRSSAVARLSREFRNWFRVQASGSIGPMCFFRAQANPRPAPSSAMSPAGYSLAPLSSKRLRFADRLYRGPGLSLSQQENMPSRRCSCAAAVVTLHPRLLVLTTKPAGMLLFCSGANSVSIRLARSEHINALKGGRRQSN